MGNAPPSLTIPLQWEIASHWLSLGSCAHLNQSLLPGGGPQIGHAPTPEARGGVHLIQTPLTGSNGGVVFSKENWNANTRRRKSRCQKAEGNITCPPQTPAMYAPAHAVGDMMVKKSHPSPQGTDIVGETKRAS